MAMAPFHSATTLLHPSCLPNGNGINGRRRTLKSFSYDYTKPFYLLLFVGVFFWLYVMFLVHSINTLSLEREESEFWALPESYDQHHIAPNPNYAYLLEKMQEEEVTENKMMPQPTTQIISPRQALEETCCHCCKESKCNLELNGVFVGDFEKDLHTEGHPCLSSLDVIQIIFDRLEKNLSFAWVRWGDGEMGEALGKGEYSQSLMKSLHYMSRHEDAIVNVGMWWLDKKAHASKWNQVVPPQTTNQDNTTEIETRKMMFHNSFYLPLGGPLSNLNGHLKVGWPYKIANYTVVFVGPPHLKDVPFLNPSYHFESTGVNRNIKRTTMLTNQCKEVMDRQSLHVGEDRPVIFLLAAGFSSKIIIAKLLQYKHESKNNHTQSYIDVGASIDGYVGKHSRDYNSPERVCQGVIKYDPINRYHWMKKGVCEEKYWKGYNFTSA